MSRIERSVEIDAPPEEVFDELVAWDGVRRWSTITVDHTGPARCSSVGETFEQTIRIAGIDLRTHWEVTEYDPPRTVAYRATGPAGSEMRMRQHVTPRDGASRLGLEIDYQLPGGVLGYAADHIYVRRRNEREAERTLANLEELLERQQG